MSTCIHQSDDTNMTVTFEEPLSTESYTGDMYTTLFGERVSTVVLDEFLNSGTPSAKSINNVATRDNVSMNVFHKAIAALIAVDVDRVIFTDRTTVKVDSAGTTVKVDATGTTVVTTTVVVPRSSDAISSIFVTGGIPFTVRFTPIEKNTTDVIAIESYSCKVTSGKPFKVEIPGAVLECAVMSIDIHVSESADSDSLTEIELVIEHSILRGGEDGIRAKMYEDRLTTPLTMQFGDCTTAVKGLFT